jgi:ABC-type transporter Mla subunit MlaD
MNETSKRVLAREEYFKKRIAELEAEAAVFRDRAEVLEDALAHSRAAVGGLAKRVAELEAALKPFAFAAGVFGDSEQVGAIMHDAPVTFHTNWRAVARNAPVLRGADFNAVRAALAKGGK